MNFARLAIRSALSPEIRRASSKGAIWRLHSEIRSFARVTSSIFSSDRSSPFADRKRLSMNCWRSSISDTYRVRIWSVARAIARGSFHSKANIGWCDRDLCGASPLIAGRALRYLSAKAPRWLATIHGVQGGKLLLPLPELERLQIWGCWDSNRFVACPDRQHLGTDIGALRNQG